MSRTYIFSGLIGILVASSKKLNLLEDDEPGALLLKHTGTCNPLTSKAALESSKKINENKIYDGNINNKI